MLLVERQIKDAGRTPNSTDLPRKRQVEIRRTYSILTLCGRARPAGR